VRVLKPIGNYLWRKAAKSLALGILLLVPFFVLFITSIHVLPFYIDFGRYETNRGSFMVLLLVAGFIFSIYPFRNYRSGLAGERKVAATLAAALSSEYSLFNDVTLRNYEKGNIDHIVVGPTGIFAIETKNNRGGISYYGDNWEGIKGQPSVQARVNAVRIRNILKNSEEFKHRTPLVHGVVVFSNNQASLTQKKPPDWVKVLRIEELAGFLTKEPRILSAQDIESIEMEIHKNISINGDG
jgi:hypothetical protein